MNDVISVGIGGGLGTLQVVAFGLGAVHQVLIGREAETRGEVEILIPGNRYINRARLIHRQQYRSKNQGRGQRPDKNRNLLKLRCATDEKPRLQILGSGAAVGSSDTDDTAD